MNLSTDHNQTPMGSTMADTPPVRKFLFDRSFDGVMGGPQRSTAPERKPVTLKAEQLDALKKEAWDEGHAAGQKTTVDEATLALTAIFTQIENRMATLIENFQEVYKSQENQTRTAVLAIARKILPEFTSRHGVQEIESLVNGAITDMLREPRLVVRIHESQFDTINARINEITTQKAYTGKVVVLADAGIAVGDCLIEWADGGIERNAEATWQDVEKAVAPEQTQNPTSGE